VYGFGHTHQPKAERYGPTLPFNPGSAGPKRFKLPRSLGLLTISDGRIERMLIALGERADWGTGRSS
jgi:predicted phosphodiesterase